MSDLENEIIDKQEIAPVVDEQGGTGKEPDAPVVEPDSPVEEEISLDPVDEVIPEEKPVSRRESKRIQQLLDKMAQFDETRTAARPGATKRETPQVIPEGEYDIDQINEMAQKYGESLYERGLSEAQAYNIATTFSTRLEIDAPRVNGKYNFLDKESDQFNPGVAGLVNRMYLNTVGYDPNTGVVQNMDLRYGEFVEGFMEAIELISAGKVADNTKNVAEQAARTGIRPGGSRKPVYKGTNPKQMTDEQLDAAIAATLGM